MYFVFLLAAVFVVLAFREYVQHAVEVAAIRARARDAQEEADFVDECCCRRRKS